MSLPGVSSATNSRVPIIDIGPFVAGDPGARRSVAHQIRAALEDIGFFGIANHGVSGEVVERTFETSRRFFALPLEAKLRVKINSAHRGYMPMSDQHRVEAKRPNLSESFLLGLDLGPNDPDTAADKPLHGPNQWLPEPAGFRAAMEAYHRAMTDLGFKMLDLFEAALDVEPGFFSRNYRKPMAFVRALHYPPAPADLPPDQFGAAPHSDFGFMTILAQDAVGGLQVRTRAGEWIDVPNLPGVFVVNVGDMLMRWTNDRFVSTVHRVINAKGRDRYSLPFFFDPDFDTEVRCIATCQGPGNPPRYEPTTWGEFVTARFDANHAYRRAQEANASKR
jgi:isopenicillin N synthase-like dioxygenase